MGILIFNGSTSVTAEHKQCGNWQRCSDVANLGGIKSVSASWYVTDYGERKEFINAWFQFQTKDPQDVHGPFTVVHKNWLHGRAG